MPMLKAAIPLIALAIGTATPTTGGLETEVGSRFEEQRVEFHNHDVKLAGSLLLPKSEAPVPAVVFVHGAGRHTRESQREVGEFFANKGIAALIYDKRGTGDSSGLYESRKPYVNLVNDALSAITFLKQRREIATSQIGIWGLSQGAYISAAAAARSEDIKFIITVGASVADGQMFYYRDNLFRRYGLSNTLRDMAEKVHLMQMSLLQMQDDSFRSSLMPRTYPPPDQYVHPAWSHVHQPVLAMWGELDQNVPVGESVAGLKNSLKQTNNEKWTIIILPRANHDLGMSETGKLHSQWLGYSPGALKTMTDWAWKAIDHPTEVDKMKQQGVARNAEILPRLAGYESLSWYGNLTVQSALWFLFLISFLANTVACLRHVLSRFFYPQQSAAVQEIDKVLNFKRALSALNLLILVALTITMLFVVDQRHPSCPTVLLFLPLLGTISTLATIALLIVVAKTRRDHEQSAVRKLYFSLEILCLILFVPYMCYWNLIRFQL